MDVQRHDETHDTKFYDDITGLMRDAEKEARNPTTKQIRIIPKVGRNDPCPCGSGRKAKKCCWDK